MEWIIAAAGRDAALVRQAQQTCLHLCARLSSGGQFEPLAHPSAARGDLLGILDGGGTPSRPAQLAFDAVSAAQARGYSGILADFDRPDLADTIAALDAETERCGLTFYVPLAAAGRAPHGVAVVETALSSGSLEQKFRHLLAGYGPEHVAAQLVRACTDYPLPSPEPEGIPLSPEDFDTLRRRTAAPVFFSSELCAKYFTWSDGSASHFVVFDDASTMQAKTRLLRRVGVQQMFVLYPDARELELL